MTAKERQRIRDIARVDMAKALHPERWERVRAAVGECARGIDPDVHAALVVELVTQRGTS